MIDIARFAYEPDCVLGVLVAGDFECFTLERPWLGNLRGRSCIPEGEYAARVYESPRLGKSILLADVPDRTEILIHRANRASELRGCIAPGMALGALGRERAVLASAGAMHELLRVLGGQAEFSIQVRFAPHRYAPAT